MMMEWQRLLSTKRLCKESGRAADGRKALEVDLDRVTFSQSFRRLNDKTQVHPLSDNDQIRTRLTHSLEVASVGRSLGTGVGTEVIRRHGLEGFSPADFGYVVQAACLPHDIGNPPFGHSGEFAMRRFFKDHPAARGWLKGLSAAQARDLETFEGNAQGLRILTNLENHRGRGGLQLTCATLATFLKYPWGSEHGGAKGKFSYFQAEAAYVAEVAGAVGLIAQGPGRWCRHPLAYLVEAADDICYAVADLEDGVELGMLTLADYESMLMPLVPEARRGLYSTLEWRTQKLGYLRSFAIGQFTSEAIAAFLDNEAALLQGRFEGDLTGAMPSGPILRQAKAQARDVIFLHPRKMRAEVAAFDVLSGLLEAFGEAVFASPDDYRADRLRRMMGEAAPLAGAGPYDKLLAVTDFISGMTDRFAVSTYQAVRGISL